MVVAGDGCDPAGRTSSHVVGQKPALSQKKY